MRNNTLRCNICFGRPSGRKTVALNTSNNAFHAAGTGCWAVEVSYA
jgi:hypothetical protein